jgi:hypothetical protein
MKRSGAWKNWERKVAEKLKGKRVLRGNDFSKKSVDVKIKDFPTLKLDCKFRQKWAHHKFLAEIIRKYCTKPGDIPVLLTKTPRQIGGIVCIPLDAFAVLLDSIRELRQERGK